MSEPVRYEFDDSRRPTPELQLRVTMFPLVDGKPVIENGNLFTLETFEECVKNVGFTDWDGTGYYGFAHGYSNQFARPSAIFKGQVDRYWTHVMWFNK
jgi:hypothetical protein